MKKSSPVEPSLLFVGTLYSNKEHFITARDKLTGLFGRVAMESPDMGFNSSDYYSDELGWPITRTFIFFSDRIDPLGLPEIKLATNNIENQLSSDGKRNINIDPGYMTLSKIVLASTKNYSHRIHVGKGIFAEVTLVYVNGRYQPHIFTYQDYASDEYMRIFEDAREILKKSQ